MTSRHLPFIINHLPFGQHSEFGWNKMSVYPYRQSQDLSDPLLEQGQTTVQAVQVGEVQAARAAQERIQVRKFGKSVSLRDSIYSKTNFYIQQSRPYIPHKKLRTYFYIRFMRWVFLIYCVLCIPMPFVPNFMWPWAAATGGIALIWLLIFAQHMHVVYWTIPQVLSQPILSDDAQPQENDFYEFKVERVEGVYLSARDSGIGIHQAAAGSIKFQALNETAACTVRKSCCLSCCMLWVTIVAVAVSAGIFAYRFTATLTPQFNVTTTDMA